ncbi:MAG: methyltransferase domain-containing protein [Spirochaetales bacterium]|nr:methyltransferase domain-containing protein [Spirochaetales bacterium]
MFKNLTQLNSKPENQEIITTCDLWTDPHRASQMLNYHLDPESDISSRKHGFIKKSAQWIYDYFKLGPNKLVADFGCGPGLYTQALAKMGAQLTGIDFSSPSLTYAKTQAQKAGLAIDYIQGNYLELSLDKSYDLVIMIFCDFCALSPKQRVRLKFNKLVVEFI